LELSGDTSGAANAIAKAEYEDRKAHRPQSKSASKHKCHVGRKGAEKKIIRKTEKERAEKRAEKAASKQERAEMKATEKAEQDASKQKRGEKRAEKDLLEQPRQQ